MEFIHLHSLAHCQISVHVSQAKEWAMWGLQLASAETQIIRCKQHMQRQQQKEPDINAVGLTRDHNPAHTGLGGRDGRQRRLRHSSNPGSGDDRDDGTHTNSVAGIESVLNVNVRRHVRSGDARGDKAGDWDASTGAPQCSFPMSTPSSLPSPGLPLPFGIPDGERKVRT